jgi:hypothetical protein
MRHIEPNSLFARGVTSNRAQEPLEELSLRPNAVIALGILSTNVIGLRIDSATRLIILVIESNLGQQPPVQREPAESSQVHAWVATYSNRVYVVCALRMLGSE